MDNHDVHNFIIPYLFKVQAKSKVVVWIYLRYSEKPWKILGKYEFPIIYIATNIVIYWFCVREQKKKLSSVVIVIIEITTTFFSLLNWWVYDKYKL